MERLAILAVCVLPAIACGNGSTPSGPTGVDGAIGSVVQRTLRGTVLEEHADITVANATVTALDATGDSVQTVTDQNGRFTLPIREDELTVEVKAPDFTVLRSRVNVADEVQLRLEPAILESSWSGTFTTTRPRFPLGIPTGDRSEFETHHRGWVSVTAHAGCSLQGTYDEWEVSLHTPSARIEDFSLSPSLETVTERRLLDAGRYVLVFDSSDNAYARPGCAWKVALARPH